MSKAQPKVTPAAAPAASRFNFEGIDADELSDITTGNVATPNAKPEEVSGKPLMLVIGSIIEDPDQPRTQFDPEALQELADSIQADGIRSPISVKPKNADGKYQINHGARRWRAAKLAKLKHVPVIIDDTHDNFAQVVENIQRDNLKPMEIARFIQKQLDAGSNQKQIGARLGKGKAWVAKHAALAGCPDWLAAAADSGRINSLDAIYDLTSFISKHPEHVAAAEAFVSEKEVLIIADVRSFAASMTPSKTSTPAEKVSSSKLSDNGEPSDPASEGEGDEAETSSGRDTITPTEPNPKVSSSKLLVGENTNTSATPTRTMTAEEQEAAARQHKIDEEFRAGQQGVKGREDGESASRPAREGESGTGPATPPAIKTILNPCVRITDGKREGALNLRMPSIEDGTVRVRFDDSANDEDVGIHEITILKVIEDR